MKSVHDFLNEARAKIDPKPKKGVSSTDKPQTAEEEQAVAQQKPTTAMCRGG